MQESDKLRISSHYLCVHWFKELARKINEDGRQNLIDRARRVHWSTKNSQILNYGDEGIDPFSFIYFLASKNTSDQFETVYRSVHQIFEPNASDISNFPEARIFPTPIPIAKLLFHDGVNFHQRLLWNLFRQVVTSEQIVLEDYREVLGIKNVDVTKLTHCLYLINPDRFHPIDDSKNLIFSKSRVQIWKRKIKKNGFTAYENAIAEINSRFPDCKPYEINLFNYLQSQSGKKDFVKLVNSNSRFFQIGANAFADGVDVMENAHEEEKTPSFSEGSCVYTGGPNSTGGQPFKGLSDPIRGDIVLVRKGYTEGRGIGVVLENEYTANETYPNGWDQNKAIRVVWINKLSSDLRKVTGGGFSEVPQDKKTYAAFKAAYPSTFNMIDSIVNGDPTLMDMLPDDTDVDSGNSDRCTLNTIFYGPPGTGKTYATFKRCVEICDGEVGQSEEDAIRERYKQLRDEDKRIEFVTFHQSYSYEEFVEGLRPKVVKDNGGGFRLKVRNGVLKRIAKRAQKNSEHSYVLVIDEINRANISKVLGELVTLLEDDKRQDQINEISVTLPYSGDSFVLPNNLYILGTMNTADRSIALLDTALRRRFEFEEIEPDPAKLSMVDDIDLREVLRAINRRLEWFIDRDHLIGHAWFMKAKSKEQVDRVMRNKTIPLIAEYFYDDWHKVQSVLGGGEAFVRCDKLDDPPGWDNGGGDGRVSWRVKDTFEDDAYEELINGPAQTNDSSTD